MSENRNHADFKKGVKKEKARNIADKKLTYDEVSWDDDWPVTDVQPEF